MNEFLYPRLAAQNILKNRKFYFPYLLTIIGTSAALYILCALQAEQNLPDSLRYVYLQTFVSIGIFVVTVFSVIFLFYTNSFLMKRRKKEIALYNILGMGKRHIAGVLGFETLYISLAGIGGGLIAGMLFQKLVTMSLFYIMDFDFYYTSEIHLNAVLLTILIFVFILFLNLLYNLRRIHTANPIQLLQEGMSGEKEPKTRWFLTIIGILFLGGGYTFALTARSVMEAFTFYFVAVLFVILGTYCLFTAVSITVLKLLRKNRKFYYQTSHFIGVSGMLYRMKRNAVGLANICILSTMVLVMVSGTLALFLGTEDILDAYSPFDLVAEVRFDPALKNPFRPDDMVTAIEQRMEEEGYSYTPQGSVTSLSFSATYHDGELRMLRYNYTDVSYLELKIIPEQSYCEQTGAAPALQPGQAYFYFPGNDTGASLDFYIDQESQESALSFSLQELPAIPENITQDSFLVSHALLVVPNDDILKQLFLLQKKAYPESYSLVNWSGYFDIDAEADQIIAFAQDASSTIGNVGEYRSYVMNDRASKAKDSYAMNGGFFFLGVFLGLLFTMAAVLIIYYKQLSEGYEDRERFQIMQKVGLDKKQIRQSINSQVLMVFFLPLLVSAIHVAMNFRLVSILLLLFNLDNSWLTLFCTVATLFGFIVIYSLVYLITAKTYYRIVSR